MQFTYAGQGVCPLKFDVRNLMFCEIGRYTTYLCPEFFASHFQ